MTSFMIQDHLNRPVTADWKDDESTCIFCRISRRETTAHIVYEDEKVIAFLDILPLRPGHTLLVPKAHYARISELPSEHAAALGKAIPKVSNALTKALDNTGLNVVCNQEYAQAVSHVHFHIIPAPRLNATSSSTPTVVAQTSLPHKEMHRKEFEAREELDSDDAAELVKRISARL
ncbi:HIT-like protein [Stereum hirsutum FP-91666 SS1]|uniref:HIT-like protein n=1 Tax=Stereum hirsutum (strain FP-91666) TaxID=721885 RepID=UPI0004449485|nr:HIT-like protein [Stereum hirsutum FP-91666 SS1]EIM85879.1 HIT-like protein [Stereum hirsutum FP-91666 SS1]